MHADDMRRGLASALVALALAMGAGQAAAQGGERADTLVVPERAAPVRVGVALSGGSAKGLAHVGVLRVLERRGIDAHVVTGTSMGAIVGGLYATGLSVDSLASLFTALDWDALMRDQAERSQRGLDQRVLDERTVLSLPLEGARVRLPSGVVQGRAGLRALQRLTWPVATSRDFAELPRAFGAVATDLGSGEAVPLRAGVLADAIRASLSLPGAMEPMRIGGRVLIDGGIARNLPAIDARELGATFVVCSDVSDSLRAAEIVAAGSLVDVLVQTQAFGMQASNERQRGQCDVLIRPDLDGLGELDFRRAGEWIERGEQAAEAALDSVGVPEDEPWQPRPLTRLPARLRIDRVDVEGTADPDAQRLVRRTVDALSEAPVDAEAVDAAIAELYATDLFGIVRYRVEAAGADTVLVLEVTDRPGDRVGLGFRYDERWRAALLFTATVYNRLTYGSATRIELRLGEELQARGSYLVGRGVTGRFSLGGSAAWSKAPIDLYEGERRVARVDVESVSAGVLVGAAVRSGGFAGVEARGEWYRGTGAIAAVDTTDTDAQGSLAAFFMGESFDRTDLPMAGSSVDVRAEWGVGTVRPGGMFRQYTLDLVHLRPVSDAVSLRLALFAGYAEGEDLALHRRYYVGGVHPSAVFQRHQPGLWGLSAQERAGRTAQVVRVGVQWELSPGRVLSAGVEAGDARDRWAIDPDRFETGWGLSLASTSIAGPVELLLTGGSVHAGPKISVRVGRRF